MFSFNGKKKKITREDFEKAMRDSDMDDKAIANIFNNFSKALPKWNEVIKESFLPVKKQIELHNLINRMSDRLSLLRT